MALPLALVVSPERATANRISSSDTLVVASNWPLVDLDPHGAYDAGSGLMSSGIYEGLIRIRPGTSDEYAPAIAESWESNQDFSSWTFHLRDDVTFHDGSRCGATAVHASFERLLALGFAPAHVLSRFVQTSDQIQVVDDLTLRFELGRPQRVFEAAMASHFGTGILNVAAVLQYEQDNDWGHGWAQSNATGLGTGPYEFVSFDQLDGIELKRFSGYWRGWEGAHFDRVVARVVPEGETRRELIERGEVDIVVNPQRESIDDLSENEDLQVDRGRNLLVHYLAMTQTGPLASPEARQALCWAFPYYEVLDGAYSGFASQARSAVSELCNGFAPVSGYTFDAERAKSLLEAAGVPEGTKLTSLYSTGNTLVQTILQLFQARLAEIGIELEISEYDLATYYQMIYSDLPAEERPSLLPLLWQPDYNDAWSQLWPTTSCETWETGNIGQFCNAEVDEMLLVARDAPDEQTYQAALNRVQEIVAVEDPVAIYVAQPEWITVLRADIEGYVLNLLAGEVLDFYALSRRES